MPKLLPHPVYKQLTGLAAYNVAVVKEKEAEEVLPAVHSVHVVDSN